MASIAGLERSGCSFSLVGSRGPGAMSGGVDLLVFEGWRDIRWVAVRAAQLQESTKGGSEGSAFFRCTPSEAGRQTR